MAESGKYLYCVIRCPQDRAFDGAGIGDEGVVHTVSYNGLSVVMSDSPLEQYESTRKNMLAHEKVLERVMPEFPLLPVRFGTVANSASPLHDIRKLLKHRFEEFQKLLGEMGDKAELGLKAFWRDEKAVFEEIVAENGAIRRLRDSLSGKSVAASHFERIRLGEMVQEALKGKRAAEAARILLPLRPLASLVKENPVLLDRMIVNAAFLVERRREQQFDEAVGKLDRELGERRAFKYVGPTPPYNFVNIVVNWEEL